MVSHPPKISMRPLPRNAFDRPVAPLRLRDLPNLLLAFVFIYVAASNYDPLWIFEPLPPATVSEPVHELLITHLPSELDQICVDPLSKEKC